MKFNYFQDSLFFINTIFFHIAQNAIFNLFYFTLRNTEFFVE